MINSRNITQDLKYLNALNIQTISSDAVINGNAIDLENVAQTGSEISLILKTGVVTAGKIAFQDFQFSNDNTFATGVVVVNGADYLAHFTKGDDTSSVDAISQTLISTSHTVKKIGLHIPVANYRYCRPRFISSNSANLLATAEVVLTQGNNPINQ